MNTLVDYFLRGRESARGSRASTIAGKNPASRPILTKRGCMTNEEVAKFADWLEKNQPGLEGKEYWELFAYRIADYLQV